jgi:hypothetical protein
VIAARQFIKCSSTVTLLNVDTQLGFAASSAMARVHSCANSLYFLSLAKARAPFFSTSRSEGGREGNRDEGNREEGGREGRIGRDEREGGRERGSA